jgi:hypothetical protein
MSSSYSVFGLDSGNLAGDYPNLEQALMALSRFHRTYGSTQLMDYGLLEIREDGELGESWDDEVLLEKVEDFAKHSTVLSRSA